MYLTARNNMYNVLNEMFRAPFFTGSDSTGAGMGLMKANILEKDAGYALELELPGYAKEDIQAELKDGYLVITAKKTAKKEDEGKFLRRDCFTGTVKRSFYVGDYLHEDDIKASYVNGILELEIPKEPEPVPEMPKLITIA